MTPRSQKFNAQYAKTLIKIAEGDLESAKVLASSKSGRLENIFFIAQQAIEESLKAVLIHNQLNVPLTHDLEALMSIFPNQITLPEGRRGLEGMSEFATIRRYEEGYLEITDDEVQIAIATAERFVTWGKTSIEKKSTQ